MVKPTFPDILPGVDSQQFSQPSVVPGRSHELLLTDLTVTGKVHQTKTIVIETVDGEMFEASKYLNKFSISSGTTSFFPFSFRESGGSWPRATRVLTISFLDITLFPTLPKILILTWHGRIEIFPVVESERSQPFLLPRELRVDRVEEDEDVLELHVVVLVPVQQSEQLFHQLPLRFTGQRLDEGGELLEVQFSITRPELLLLLSCFVSPVPGVSSPEVPAYLNCFLLEVGVVPSKAEVPAGNVVEQLGLCLTHQQQLVHLNTLHSCASLTGKCKQSVLISNKCHSQIQLECLGLSK